MQVMAIGTLALCYNNHRVFTGKQLLVSLMCFHINWRVLATDGWCLRDLDTVCWGHLQGLQSNSLTHAGVVKMRRGETAKYVQLLGNMGDLYRAFELFSGRLASQ